MNGSAAQRQTSDDLIEPELERAIVERLKKGDRTAFATLYGWYGDRLFRQVILPRLPEREAAEDVLRDTFKKALEKIDTFHYMDRSIFFWLRRIAINLAMDTHRSRRRDLNLVEAVGAEPEAPIQQPFARPDRGLEVEDTREQVEISLSRMNERYAHVLRLRLIEDRTREECASILEVTLGNLDVLLHRACKAFRKVYPP